MAKPWVHHSGGGGGRTVGRLRFARSPRRRCQARADNRPTGHSPRSYPNMSEWVPHNQYASTAADEYIFGARRAQPGFDSLTWPPSTLPARQPSSWRPLLALRTRPRVDTALTASHSTDESARPSWWRRQVQRGHEGDNCGRSASVAVTGRWSPRWKWKRLARIHDKRTHRLQSTNRKCSSQKQWREKLISMLVFIGMNLNNKTFIYTCVRPASRIRMYC